MLDVDRIRKEFPIYKKKPELHFFDSAASSLKHKNSIKLLSDFLKYNGTNVHRAVYDLGNEATEAYENARDTVADFIKANRNEIVFTKSTTHSINMLAQSLSGIINEGDEIIVSELEHHANLLPWQNLALKKNAILKFIPLENGMITIENFKKTLSEKTKLVATHHISNVMGYVAPIKEMIKLAHKKGALVLVDAAQSVHQIKIDVKKLDVDFLAFSGHKMYGPFGIGVLYGKEELLNNLPPAEFGGEMVDQVYLDKPTTYKEAPYNFEAGTPAIAEAIGLVGAIKFIKKTGLKKMFDHGLYFRNYILDQLKDETGITIYNKDGDTSLISFNIDDVHPHDAASFFNQYGVSLRAGQHCNQLTMKYLGVNSTLRASIGVYNNKEDCDVFIKALKETKDFFNQF